LAAYFKDVREHIAALEQNGLLIRVGRKVNKDTELHPLVRLQFRGLPEERRKAFLFTNVTDSSGRRFDIPVAVACLAASREIYAIGMRCEPDKIVQKWTAAREKPLEPVLVTTGPVHDEIHTEKELDGPGLGLDEFPIPISTPGFDAGPYTSASHWVTKDPETGIRNVGTYRGMVKSPARLGMNAGAPQHISQHFRKWQKIGKPMPVAVIVGAPPNVSYASVVKVPYGVDEYAVAGALAGEPVPLVKAKTVDLEVPAHAEIVIEGYVNTEMMEPEAPFGEFTGYMDPQQLNPFLEITCITHRKNPVFVTMLSQFPPSESSKIRQVGSEGVLISHLRGLGFNCVKDAAYYEAGACWGLCCIQVSKPKEREAAAILDAYSESPVIQRGKVIIVVDDDVDPRDLESVVWAMSYRLQPHRDVRTKRTVLQSSDLSAFPPWAGDPGGIHVGGDEVISTLLLVDATRKWAYPPVSLPPEGIMKNALAIWKELGLEDLKLRTPWYGYELGWWPDAEREAARMAVEGRYYETGDKMKNNRVAARKNA
jgi:4-hydroxy-3-polyprenylbenzoate decarboxylase